jgi:predicted amidohydrolase
VTGLARRRANGIANSAVAISPDGQIVAEYDKICLFGAAEQEAFVAGRHIVIFDSPIGRTALAICFDVEQADLVDRIARAGATDLIVPTANMWPYHQVSEKTLPTRAKTAGIRIVYANHAGIDGELTMLGQSTIVTPRGETVTMLGNSPALSEIYMTPNPVDRSGTTSRPVDDPSLNP